MENILIKNVTILPMTGQESMIKTGEIAISSGLIHSIGPTDSSGDFKADKVIDAHGLVAMPGLVNCHTHAAMSLLRSYADDLPLMDWLNNEIWPTEAKMVAEDIYWGSMLNILEMIKSGTTTFLDMYDFMEDVARAVEESGIRACLSRGMIGFNPNAEAALEQNKALIRNWHGAAGGRITTMLGPHAPYTCPPEFLAKVVAAAEEYKVGMNIHVAETQDEIAGIKKDYGKTPVEYLNDLGIFDFPTVAAHCVHLSDSDIEILKAKDVRVAHNPESNMKLASGVAPIPKLLKAGITVGLGTDGASSNNNQDMIGEMRTASFLQKLSNMDTTVMKAYDTLEMATANGAKVLRLDKEIGTLEKGKKADIILVNFEQPHLYPKYDFYANMVYSAGPADVHTVLVDGKILMENRQVLSVDEEKVMFEAQKRASILTAK